MFWSRSFKTVETQTTEIDNWILHHARMRPYIEGMQADRERLSKKALQDAMNRSKERICNENMRIKEIDLSRDNASLKLAADALLKNIKRQQMENQRSLNDASHPRWLTTNYWKIQIAK
jgi:hypothetical protein